MSDLHELAERAQRLRSLTELPAWDELRTIARERRTREYARLAAELMRGDYPNRGDLEYRRGVLDGIDQILAAPESADTKLERALKKENTDA
jgi:hypothetical protein